MKSLVIQTFLTSHSMDSTLKSDHSLESCRAVLYCGAVLFQFYPVCNLAKFVSFGFGTVRSKRVNVYDFYGSEKPHKYPC